MLHLKDKRDGCLLRQARTLVFRCSAQENLILYVIPPLREWGMCIDCRAYETPCRISRAVQFILIRACDGGAQGL